MSSHVRSRGANEGHQAAHPVAGRAERGTGETRGKQKVTALGIAGGLGVTALILAVYGVGFAFATITAGLSEALPLRLSLLIVTATILSLTAVAGLLAVRFGRKATPPTPTQAVEEAQRTVEALRSHV